MSVNMHTHPRPDWDADNMVQNTNSKPRHWHGFLKVIALVVFLLLIAVIVQPTPQISDQPGASDVVPVAQPETHMFVIDQTCSPFGALGSCITAAPPA